MNGNQPLRLHLGDCLSQLGRHHVARVVNLVHWQSEMVQPVSEPVMIYFHLFVEWLRATVDVRATGTGLYVQDFVHIIGTGSKNYLRLHISNILRSFHGHCAENVLLPLEVRLLGSLVDRDMGITDRVWHIKMFVVG